MHPTQDFSALGHLVDQTKPAKRRTIADNIAVKFDPYQSAVAVMEYRLVDRDAHTVTFVFNDDSKLVFDVKYTVRKP